MVLLVLACAAQCRAFMATRQLARDCPLPVRMAGGVLACTSLLVLLLWVGMIAMGLYYVLHPGAPPLFGGT